LQSFLKENKVNHKDGVKMSEEKVAASSLVSQGKNIGYYAALLYGIGYILTTVSVVILTIEWFVLARGLDAWDIAIFTTYLIGMIFAIVFSASIIRKANIVKTSVISPDIIISLISTFTMMLVLYGVGTTILASAIKESLFGPVCYIVGAVLLLMGFRTYQSKGVAESKLIGAILMLVSLILIYLVAAPQSIFSALFRRAYWYAPYSDPLFYILSFIQMILKSPLFSEQTLEFIALLLAVIGALIFALRIASEKLQHAITSVILSISGLLFSIGVMYLNFTSASDLSNWLGYASNVPQLSVLWISVIGMILLGIGGIMALIASIIPLVSTASQLSVQMPAAAPSPPPPPPSAKIKRG
jgi:hypothetical protein